MKTARRCAVATFLKSWPHYATPRLACFGGQAIRTLQQHAVGWLPSRDRRWRSSGLQWKTKRPWPTTAVWLLIKRTLGAHPQYWYYLSNAPVSASLRLFVWLSGVRWAIEQYFEETKTELGMDLYEVRKCPGWHHHMLTCMLAH